MITMSLSRLPVIGALIATGAVGYNVVDRVAGTQPVPAGYFADDPTALTPGFAGQTFERSLFGGPGDHAAQFLPNLAALAPNGLGVGGVTGIPELDAIVARGAVTLPAMIDALRQSGRRLGAASPGGAAGNELLRCLGDVNGSNCGAVVSEVNTLHAEMVRLSESLLFGKE